MIGYPNKDDTVLAEADVDGPTARDSELVSFNIFLYALTDRQIIGEGPVFNSNRAFESRSARASIIC
jgi:hypothetical protein